MPPRFLPGPQMSDEHLADSQAVSQFVEEEKIMIISGSYRIQQIPDLIDFFYLPLLAALHYIDSGS